MDVDKEELYDSLVIWLETFELPSSGSSLTAESIASGIPIAEALHVVDASYFDESVLFKMAKEVDPNNWRVKSSNLRKVLKGMVDYFSDIIGTPLPSDWRPNVNKMAQDTDKGELSHLLSILIGVVVNCARKEEFIPKMLMLPESAQKSVMTAINEVNSRTKAQGSSEEKIRQLNEELEKVKENYQEASRRCFELDAQVSALQDEKQMLVLENQKVLSRVSEANMEDPASPASRKLHQVQSNVDRLQEDMYKLEAANDELQLKLDTSASENEELKGRIDELVAVEHEYRRLKDEVDELRSKADDARKYENTLETYRRKIEDQSDLKAQVKILEEKNENYMKSVIELEEEQRKNNTLKTQMESYKKQIQELDVKLQSEVRRADKADFELKKVSVKLEEANRDKERLLGEKSYWKEYSEELKAKEAIAGSSSEGEVSSSTAHSGLIAAGSTSELKEQLLRLEAENSMLKSGSAGKEELELLESNMEDALARKQELETENRLANQKIMELERRLEEMETRKEKEEKGGDERLVAKHREAETLSVEMEKLRRRSAELNKESEQQLFVMKNQLEAKDSELKAQEAKFKLYMEKARTVITSLEQSGGGRGSRTSSVSNDLPSGGDLGSLKKELEAKEKLIQKMQEEEEKTRIMKEQEERLITTAFHSMAMQLQKNAVQDRLVGAQGSPISFLGRQRQVVTRKGPAQANQGMPRQHNTTGGR